MEKQQEEEEPAEQIPESVEDYEKEAHELLPEDKARYVFGATETGMTLRRNLLAFSNYALRRRVLQGIKKVDLSCSFFGGKIMSALPFFPSSINVTALYQGAVFDILKISQNFEIPIFVSHFAIDDSVDILSLPSQVPETSSLVWQIYLKEKNLDATLKQAAQAQKAGFKALALTVDTEWGIKLQNRAEFKFLPSDFLSVTSKELSKIRKASSLPLIVKGIMAYEDAEAAIECGADGIVVSNHGGRTLDQGEASLDVLPEIVKRLKGKKKTRKTEIFFDGGIRRGTDILKALALGARGCLIGRPLIYGLVVAKDKGALAVMEILRDELARAAALTGVRKIESVDKNILRPTTTIK
jgi:isopentenyl diphosphate isomerase/L-lactate dehydrogenase-like FMN-dependent dehydrogenase